MPKLQSNLGQYDMAKARDALRQLRAPIDRARAERDVRIQARRAENDRRQRAARERHMTGPPAPRPMTMEALVRKHCRGAGGGR